MAEYRLGFIAGILLGTGFVTFGIAYHPKVDGAGTATIVGKGIVLAVGPGLVLIGSRLLPYISPRVARMIFLRKQR